MDLKVLQWNSQSLHSNKIDFLKLLEKYQIDVALISETFLKKDTYFSVWGYNVLRCDRHERRGGVAIIVRSNISFTPIKINTSLIPNYPPGLELIAAKIKVKPSPITFVSVYIRPPTRVPLDTWQSIIDQLSTPVIFGGDFNCHHPAWGSRKSDAAGNCLLKVIENNNFHVLNDGSPTRLPAYPIPIRLRQQSILHLYLLIYYHCLHGKLSQIHVVVIIYQYYCPTAIMFHKPVAIQVSSEVGGNWTKQTGNCIELL